MVYLGKTAAKLLELIAGGDLPASSADGIGDAIVFEPPNTALNRPAIVADDAQVRQ